MDRFAIMAETSEAGEEGETQYMNLLIVDDEYYSAQEGSGTYGFV